MNAESCPCGRQCDHGSPCRLRSGHSSSWRHETEHGCIFYDADPDASCLPFCACGRRISECDRSRAGCTRMGVER